jgi:diguanylate cyclase (GGDEF)-like protein
MVLLAAGLELAILWLSIAGVAALASSSLDDVPAAWRKWIYGAVLIGLVLSLLIVFSTRRLVFLLAELGYTRAEAEEQALRDPLTGLPNRRMFHDCLEQEIRKTRRARQSLAIMFIDLDLFKEVNDTFGHGMGDALLRQAAQRLRSCVRDTDTIARLGGDEFTVILCGLADKHGAERVAQEILNKLAEPFSLKDEVVYISASIGITLYPQDAGNIEDLIKNADQAMYAAKKEGRNRWKYFTPSMQAATQNRMRLLNDLRGALADSQFKLHYQPVVDLKTGSIRKAEALIRWQHPTRGSISPAEFIPVMEESGMIVDVGDWVFREAAQQSARWRATIHPDFQISINKSPAQFKYKAHSLEEWDKCLNALGMPGASMAVEITEGLLLEASETVTGKLSKLSKAGIQLSLDDFGTGYSSLAYLKKFDIDYIKIDQSFVANLKADSDDMALCEAIVVMAHRMGMKVIAEGVETAAQRDLLAGIGCDYGQGFLYSQPVPAEEFERLIKARQGQRMQNQVTRPRLAV